MTENTLDYVDGHFPLKKVRRQQQEAMDFCDDMIEKGFNDIVIAAPTGVGKTAIGAALAFWAGHSNMIDKGDPGAYYLVTQKLLQDQITNDFDNYRNEVGASLKSATEYKCPSATNCAEAQLKMRNSKKSGDPFVCKSLAEDNCTYMKAKQAFTRSSLAVTNYPYFFTERTLVRMLKPRKMLIADECHTLESQIAQFTELSISHEDTEFLRVERRKIPNFKNLTEFSTWLKEDYVGAATAHVEMLKNVAEGGGNTERATKEALRFEGFVERLKYSLEMVLADPSNWVYWSEVGDDKNIKYIAKPIKAAQFFKPLIADAAEVRIYMSAFPGDKRIFCEGLGLRQKDVAWLDLDSDFPIENRPNFVLNIGSLSRRNIDRTLPTALKVIGRLVDSHADTKGIIHCVSYKLGEAIFDYLSDTDHFGRLIYPKGADSREKCFKRHVESKSPTIIISPSMTEGFDFKGELAEWQIIVKVPYPSLGNKQVAARKEQDPDWYSLQAVMTIVQASGRIVRSKEDAGATYIIDADFQSIYDRHRGMFPEWWKDSLVFT